jgi:TM2 domain-containing membrane protein YozV
MLLCFFLGGVGAHRFYLGKVATGILMILTLGGLGLWTLIDFFRSVFASYTDSNGLYVSKERSKSLAAVLVSLACASALLGPAAVAAVAIPKLARERMWVKEFAVDTAYHAVALAEEEHFAEFGRYTADYGELKPYMTVDPNVDYGDITLVRSNLTGDPGFRFIVRYKGSPGVAFEFNSIADERVRRL